MQLVNTMWNQWFEKKKADLQKTVKPQFSARPRPQPQIAFRSGDDVVYKVPEEELYGSKTVTRKASEAATLCTRTAQNIAIGSKSGQSFMELGLIDLIDEIKVVFLTRLKIATMTLDVSDKRAWGRPQHPPSSCRYHRYQLPSA